MTIRTGISLLFAMCLGGAAWADAPRVATDIAPVQSLVARVMAGVGTPSVLIRAGVSPHGYALRPSDAAAVQEADAVFWIGPELAPWLGDALDTLAPDAVSVKLSDVPGVQMRAFRDGVTFAAPPDDHDHDHDHDHAPDHGNDHDKDHGHDHSGTDPHAWLDPEHGKLWLATIADTLAALDPENAALYASNAAAGTAEIDAAQTAITARLAPYTDLRFVVFHDAYQYFEARFGLQATGAIAAGDAAGPGPARIAEIRQAVIDREVACVFSEPQFNQSLVGTVVDGTGARALVLDPLGGDIAPGPDFYTALLNDMADRFEECAAP